MASTLPHLHHLEPLEKPLLRRFYFAIIRYQTGKCQFKCQFHRLEPLTNREGFLDQDQDNERVPRLSPWLDLYQLSDLQETVPPYLP